MSTIHSIGFHIGGPDPLAPQGNKSYEIVDNLDGTGTQTTWDTEGNQLSVTQVALPIPEAPPLTPVEKLAKRLIAPDVSADVLDDEALAEVTELFPVWRPGIVVSVGEVYQHDGRLVEVIQAHTTQADWEPQNVPALFVVKRDPNSTEWEAGIAVQVGEQYTYQGTTYEVIQAHTTQVGWEPPNVPALWSVV